MTDRILHLENVGKSYPTYRSDLARFARWFGAPVKPVEEFWAVRDVCLSMNKGECIAIIGQNGAGKSTLLKLITGTVRPNRGVVNVNGGVSAILELGLGFNSEFTGRENIMYSGGLLGYSTARLKALMPEIEEFAEIGEFIDQPVRVYSSGMQARLAFSLVTAVRPEVLIVDEVLSVGDAYFQHKSFNRIREFKAQGTSILLVSHSMGDVRELSDRTVLLDKGAVVKDGNPEEVVDYYNAMISERENAKLTIEQRRNKEGWLLSRSGTYEAVVDSFRLVDAKSGDDVSTVFVGQALKLCLDIRVTEDISKLVLGLMLRDRAGHVVWGTNTWHTKQTLEDVRSGEAVRYEITFKCDLGQGSYSISPALVSTDTHLDNNYEWSDNLIVFEVVNFDKPEFIGTSYINADFKVKRG